jgi:hypothetical protein
MSLLAHRRNVYSQFGEDGIIETILRAIGETTRWCCEFGAWDGLHLSNTRRLVDAGWHAVLIEGDPHKFAKLRQNNASNPRVIPVQAMVDSESNRLESILADAGAPELDLLAIDIDGPDYEIFESLQIRPRVICVEVVPHHDPESRTPVRREVAAKDVGQPFGLFYDTARERGYRLVSYYVNAFFVREDAAGPLPSLTLVEAYEEYLAALPEAGRRWLNYCNGGRVHGYLFNNPRLTREALGLTQRHVDLRMRALAAGWWLSRRQSPRMQRLLASIMAHRRKAEVPPEDPTRAQG